MKVFVCFVSLSDVGLVFLLVIKKEICFCDLSPVPPSGGMEGVHRYDWQHTNTEYLVEANGDFYQ